MLQFFLPYFMEPKCRNLLLLTELRDTPRRIFPNVSYLSQSSLFILIWTAATTTFSAGQVDRCCVGALKQTILPFCVMLLSFGSQTYIYTYKPRPPGETIPWYAYLLFKPTQLQSKDGKIKNFFFFFNEHTHFIDTIEASAVLLASHKACGE